MKRVFSLLLVVAMLLGMSSFAFAAKADMRMNATITENDTDITVTISVENVEGMSSITSYLLSSTTSLVANSHEVASIWTSPSVTLPTNDRPTKFVISLTDTANYITTSEAVVLTYKITKKLGVSEISASDFSWGTSAINLSKVVANDTISSSSTKEPTQFTIAYVDERSSAPADEFVNDTTSAVAKDPVDSSVNVITCAGRVGAEYLSQRYGVEFTAESTVGGSRPQVFYGAKPGDTVSDGAGGTTTFVFDGWDGTFEIVLKGVHTGTKSFRFFVGSTYTDLDSKVVSE